MRAMQVCAVVGADLCRWIEIENPCQAPRMKKPLQAAPLPALPRRSGAASLSCREATRRPTHPTQASAAAARPSPHLALCFLL